MESAEFVVRNDCASCPRNASVGGYVPESDAHHVNATAADTFTFRAPFDSTLDASEYSVRDPEGHEWHFGTNRPVPPSVT